MGKDPPKPRHGRLLRIKTALLRAFARWKNHEANEEDARSRTRREVILTLNLKILVLKREGTQHKTSGSPARACTCAQHAQDAQHLCCSCVAGVGMRSCEAPAGDPGESPRMLWSQSTQLPSMKWSQDVMTEARQQITELFAGLEAKAHCGGLGPM